MTVRTVEEMLRNLLGRASDMLEHSFSGYITGSGPDMQFDTEREALVKECHEALKSDEDRLSGEKS